MENNQNEVKSNKVAATKRVSKTGTLTSLKALVENFGILGWTDEKQTKALEGLIKFVKEEIIKEL